MPNPIENLIKFGKDIWDAFQSAKNRPRGVAQGLYGSQESLRIGTSSRRNLSHGLSEIPTRPILGDYSISAQLVEMSTWSREVRHTARILSTDIFQRENGEIRSWRVKPTVGDPDDEIKVHPNVIAVGREISIRQLGKQLILGGTALQNDVSRMLRYGDAFKEISLNLEGRDRKEWHIDKAQSLPSFSMFVDVNDAGEWENTYSQRKQIDRRPDDIVFPEWKILHFKYEEVGASGRYGQSLFMQALSTYEYLKQHVPDVADAVRSAAISPWLHIMPEGADDTFKDSYIKKHQALLAQGIISNLYLLQGADVRKAFSNANESLKGTLDYWSRLKEEMVPPGVPLWFFPGLGNETNAGKDIANQPALMYARTIQSLRGLVGEQIRWCIQLELTLKFGHQWCYDNVITKGGFEIDWGIWAVNGQEFLVQDQNQNQSTQNQQLQSGSSNNNGKGKEFINLNQLR